MGCARVADDDDGGASRRAVRAALVGRRPAERCAHLPARHRPGRSAPHGEGHQDPPAAAGVARPRDGRGAHRALGTLGGARPNAGHRSSPRRIRVLARPGRVKAPCSVVGNTAVRPARETARHRHPPAQPPALQRHRADRRRRRRPHGGRPTRTQRRRGDDASGLCSVAGRGRPARVGGAGLPGAGAARCTPSTRRASSAGPANATRAARRRVARADRQRRDSGWRPTYLVCGRSRTSTGSRSPR